MTVGITWAEEGEANHTGGIRCMKLSGDSKWMVWLGFFYELVGHEFPADHPQGDGGLGPEKEPTRVVADPYSGILQRPVQGSLLVRS
jgi:hypothetical protein